MSEGVDYYDVQNMIRDARSEIRGEIDNAVRAACQQLREVTEALDRLERVLQSRTEYLA